MAEAFRVSVAKKLNVLPNVMSGVQEKTNVDSDVCVKLASWEPLVRTKDLKFVSVTVIVTFDVTFGENSSSAVAFIVGGKFSRIYI